jgi:hypothetical protein
MRIIVKRGIDTKGGLDKGTTDGCATETTIKDPTSCDDWEGF